MSETAIDTRPALPLDLDKARSVAAAALAELTERQSAWVVSFSHHGNAARATREAGYSETSTTDLTRRLRANPRVSMAIRALANLRGLEASYGPDQLRQLLETALDVSPETFLIRNDAGELVGVRDLDSLSPAERIRVKALRATVRKSAKGQRAHLVKIDVELTPVLDVLDRLARMQGLYGGEGVSVNVAALGPTAIGPAPLDPLWAEVLDALLDDAELRDYFAASNDEERRAILQPAVARLRA